MLTIEQVNELLTYTLVVKKENILELYREFIDKLKATNPPDTNPIKEKIFEINSFFPLASLSDEETQFLKEFNLYDFVGEPANDYLKTIIIESLHDKGVQQRDLRTFLSGVEEAFRRASLLQDSLYLLKPENSTNLPEIELQDNESIVSIHFQNDCNVTGLKELSSAADDWNKILIELNKLSGNEKIEGNNILFKDIRKGSLHIDIPSTVATGALLCKCISWILDIQNKYLQNKKLIQEIKENTILKEETKKQIELEYQGHLEEEREKIANDVYSKIKSDSEFHIVDNEQEISVSKLFINKLNDFIADGGDVNITFSKKETKESKELKVLYEALKLQIEYKKNPKYIDNK